jgi:hypothetical protein
MYEVDVMPDVCTRARHIMTGVAQNRRAKYTLRSLEAVRVSIAPMAVDKYSQEPKRMRTIAWAAILTTIAILTQVLVGQRPAATDDSLLITRRLVWTAFFSNDQNKLKELLPENLVAGGEDNPPWRSREEILHDAADFAAHRGKLHTLSFSHVRIQHFHEVAVVYSEYSLTGEWSEQPFNRSGNVMEVFVFHRGQWTNTGWQINVVR